MTQLVERPSADPDVAALVREVFADVRALAEGQRTTAEVELDLQLWQRLRAAGLADLTLPTSLGGSGASWHEAAVLLAEAAAARAALPLVEHDLLAGWLLHAAGFTDAQAPPQWVRVAARPDPSGVCPNVVWASRADEIVALWEDVEDWKVVRLQPQEVSIEPGRNGAGEPCDRLFIDPARLETGRPVPVSVGDQFHLRGALARSIQVVGAMERIVELLLAHVRTREQFGRPLGAFQAVQHRLAALASETALARTAVDAAVAQVSASGWAGRADLYDVSVAVSCTWHAATEVVRGAHQLFGAVGVTQEHELGGLTLPILARRSQYGAIHEWDDTLTRLALAAGPERLWQLALTGRSRPD